MTPYYADDTLTAYVGDVRAVLREMPAESVNCVVTSPPYWGLRDYGLPPSPWGGDPEHAHSWGVLERGKRKDILPTDQSSLISRTGSDDRQNGAANNGGRYCDCGAWLGNLGLEPTPALFVEHVVAVFREVKRILRPDGTLWLNLGDSYASGALDVQRVRADRGQARSGEGQVPEVLSPRGASELDGDAPGAGTGEIEGVAPGTRRREERADAGPSAGSQGESDGGAGREVPVLWGDGADLPDAGSRPERWAQGPQAGETSSDGAGGGRRVPAGALPDPLLELQLREGDGGLPAPRLKPKDRIGIPHRVVFALQDDGWWWRDEIVWHKPNAMPSSVEDRTTPAHEFMFMLTRSRRYAYDHEAIREPAVSGTTHDATGSGYSAPGQTPQAGNRIKVPGGWDTAKGSHGTVHRGGRTEATYIPRGSGNLSRDIPTTEDGRVILSNHMGRGVPWKGAFTRNKRSVWTIATQPFPGAHFATFPERLVEPCVLAGSPAGGVVLDPFGGSGTVALVANRLGRKAVYIDLNPDYMAMALRRVRAAWEVPA